MADNARLFRIGSQPPLIQLIISLFVVIVAGFFLASLLVYIGSFIFNVSPEDMLKIPAPDSDRPETLMIKYVQVSQQLALFLVPSLIVARMFKDDNYSFLRTNKPPSFLILLSVVILAVLIIPVTTYAGYLNSELDLPDRLSDLENWMRTKENEAAELTSLLITSSGLLTLSVNIAVIAVIPAVSEEFLFRGVIQQLFSRTLRSGHAGIWIAAIIFSTVHLQFYGFIPRLLLGLVFGYLFYWTGNLWTSIAAHFTNNSILVVMSYISERKPVGTDMTIEKSQQMHFPYVTLILCCLILFFLWNEVRRSGKYSGYQ